MKKKCSVIILQTAYPPYKMPYSKHIPESNLILGLEDSLNYSKKLSFKKSPDEDMFPSQHTIGNYSKQMYVNLYILSDDEIKEGDWVIKNGHTTIYQIEKDSRIDNCKKIIATTDKSLSLVCTCGATKVVNTGLCPKCHLFTNIPLLPQPSQSFIKKYITEYNKGNIITDVMVEYDEWHEEDTSRDYIPGKGQPAIKFTRLKVNKNNEITITRVKDSWSRDEVIYLCGKAFFQGKNNYLQNEKAKNFDKWIEENL